MLEHFCEKILQEIEEAA